MDRFSPSDMRTNTSSRFLPPSPLVCSVNASLYPIIFSCFDDSKNTVHYTVHTFVYLLLLPLLVSVVWTGFRQRRSRSPSAGQTSHTDVFTYCMVVMETLYVVGLFSFCCAIYACRPAVMLFGYFCVCVSTSSQSLFHCLTCVERYLAVVHPILYMGLRRSLGVQIRNISILSAWLLSFGSVGIVARSFPVFPIILYVSVLGVVVLTVCSCSLAVFCVLIRSGLRSDPAKWRAFHTIAAITGAVLLRFCGQVLLMVLLTEETRTEWNDCQNFIFGSWMSLPSSLVLPLLFLHRNRKLSSH